MLVRRSVFVAVLAITFSAAATAQGVYTPDKGSQERKAILAALRIPVERSMKQPIVFVTENFKVQGNWAFVSGTPQNSSGGRPDLSITAWKGSEDIFDDNFFGLLKKTAGKWKVVTHALGCTDVCYADWWQTYKAPKAIFPYTE